MKVKLVKLQKGFYETSYPCRPFPYYVYKAGTVWEIVYGEEAFIGRARTRSDAIIAIKEDMKFRQERLKEGIA